MPMPSDNHRTAQRPALICIGATIESSWTRESARAETRLLGHGSRHTTEGNAVSSEDAAKHVMAHVTKCFYNLDGSWPAISMLL